MTQVTTLGPPNSENASRFEICEPNFSDRLDP
jgi:hypothetical protein